MRDTGTTFGRKDVGDSGHLVLDSVSHTHPPSLRDRVEAVTEVRGDCRKATGSDIRWHLEGEAHVPWRRWELWGLKLKL